MESIPHHGVHHVCVGKESTVQERMYTYCNVCVCRTVDHPQCALLLTLVFLFALRARIQRVQVVFIGFGFVNDLNEVIISQGGDCPSHV